AVRDCCHVTGRVQVDPVLIRQRIERQIVEGAMAYDDEGTMDEYVVSICGAFQLHPVEYLLFHFVLTGINDDPVARRDLLKSRCEGDLSETRTDSDPGHYLAAPFSNDLQFFAEPAVNREQSRTGRGRENATDILTTRKFWLEPAPSSRMHRGELRLMMTPHVTPSKSAERPRGLPESAAGPRTPPASRLAATSPARGGRARAPPPRS